MNSEVRDALAKALQSMLEEAGLPKESELIGRKFAFTYTTAKNSEPPMMKDIDFASRISGTILGVQIKGYNLRSFNLTTTQFPSLERYNWAWDTNLNFNSNDGNGKWNIYLFQSDRVAGYQSKTSDGDRSCCRNSSPTSDVLSKALLR